MTCDSADLQSFAIAPVDEIYDERVIKAHDTKRRTSPVAPDFTTPTNLNPESIDEPTTQQEVRSPPWNANPKLTDDPNSQMEVHSPPTNENQESTSEPNIQREHCSPTTKNESQDRVDHNASLISGQGQQDDQSSTAKSIKQEHNPAPVEGGNDDDDDIQIIDWRVSRPQAPVEPESSSTAPTDPADPERRKRLLKMRLEELRIERELMELE